MKKSVDITVALYGTFILFLCASGLTAGVADLPLSEIFYYVAFAVPVTLFAVTVARSKGEIKLPRLLPDGEGGALSLLVAAPALFGVMGISFLTSLLLGALGKSGTTEITGGLLPALVEHALFPAVLEELLFRYIPLTLIAPHSRKSALLLSALFFALSHCNLFELPYALFAGFVYMWCDMMAGSVLPSVLFHLLNNAVAVVWQAYIYPAGYGALAFAVIGALAALSLAACVLFRGRLIRRSAFLADKSDRAGIPTSAAAYIAATAIISIYSIF